MNNEGRAPRDGESEGWIPPKLLMRAGIYASYSEMLALQGDDSLSASDQRRLDLGAGLGLNLLPERVWGGDVSAEYIRISEPSESANPLIGWERETAALDGGVSWRPLGGMLRWRLGYDFRYSWFRHSLRHYNNFEQGIATRGSFQFLPRTAFLYDGEYTFLRYQHLTSDQNPSDSIRSRLGINSLFTNRFALLAAVGWAASFYQQVGNAELHNYDGLTATAELTFFLSPQPKLKPGEERVGISSVSVGAIRDFHNSYLADYYVRTRGYVAASYLFAQRVEVEGQLGLSSIDHPPLMLRGQVVDPESERRVDFRGDAVYRITDTLGAKLSLNYDASLSDVIILVPADPAEPDSQGFADNLAYSRWQLWLGARWMM